MALVCIAETWVNVGSPSFILNELSNSTVLTSCPGPAIVCAKWFSSETLSVSVTIDLFRYCANNFNSEIHFFGKIHA